MSAIDDIEKALRQAVDAYERALEENADAIEQELRENPEYAADAAKQILNAVGRFLERIF